MIKRRRRFKQTDTLNDRLAVFAAQLREQAAKLPAGLEKADLLNRARMADVTIDIDSWLGSPGLQPPK